MLIFIDESGDPGMDLKKGASETFTIVFVIFKNQEDAVITDKKIENLKNKLRWGKNCEFHFKENSHNVRNLLLDSVKQSKFLYSFLLIRKKLIYRKLSSKEFYKKVCEIINANFINEISGSTLIIDGKENHQLKKYFLDYFKQKSRKIKIQNSNSNNLIQLADYIAGVVSRHNKKKKYSNEYYSKISDKEFKRILWP